MTTTITITTHTWPVEVNIKDKATEGFLVSTEIVPPNSKRDVYIHSTRSLELTELPAPE